MAKQNSYRDFIRFFSTPEKPVGVMEAMKFFHSLNEKERDYYLFVPLK